MAKKTVAKPAKKTVVDVKGAEDIQPPLVVGPPSVQPAEPYAPIFGGHGEPGEGEIPKVDVGVYVDDEGTRIQCEICAKRADGSFDIILPGKISGIRKDAIRKKYDDSQTGDYIE